MAEGRPKQHKSDHKRLIEDDTKNFNEFLKNMNKNFEKERPYNPATARLVFFFYMQQSINSLILVL